MSKDLSYSKRGTGSVYPERVYDSAPGIVRVEPLLTPKKFVERFFKGIPLVSPVTKEKVTVAELKDYIHRGMSLFEVESKTDATPIIRRHRLPFDPNLYHKFIHLEIPNKPIQKVIRLAICSASYQYTPQEGEKYPSGAEIYQVPNEWVEMGNAVRGILNVNPINPAFSAIGTQTAVAASGATILQFIGQMGWVPAYWVVECLHGFCSEDGGVPVVVNEMIGIKAALLLIDNLIPQYQIVSQSLSIDGLGQSVSNQMYQLLQIKQQKLLQDYDRLLKTIKNMLGNNFITSNV